MTMSVHKCLLTDMKMTFSVLFTLSQFCKYLNNSSCDSLGTFHTIRETLLVEVPGTDLPTLLLGVELRWPRFPTWLRLLDCRGGAPPPRLPSSNVDSAPFTLDAVEKIDVAVRLVAVPGWASESLRRWNSMCHTLLCSIWLMSFSRSSSHCRFRRSHSKSVMCPTTSIVFSISWRKS